VLMPDVLMGLTRRRLPTATADFCGEFWVGVTKQILAQLKSNKHPTDRNYKCRPGTPLKTDHSPLKTL